jgi:phage terminase large subunit-like protein
MRDELHALTKFHRTYYDELITGLGKFPQALDIVATTAGDEYSVIWEEELKHASQVVARGNGYEDDALFAMI